MLAHALPDGRSAVLSRDLDRTAASVDAFAPGDGDAWRRMFAEWRRIAEPVLDALFTPFPPMRSVAALTEHGYPSRGRPPPLSTGDTGQAGVGGRDGRRPLPWPARMRKAMAINSSCS